MAGPYTWRPPTYWFSGRYRAAQRRVGRAGRQRTHSAVRQPEEVHPARQAVADQRLLVLPRRFQPGQRRADAASSAAINRRYGPSSSAEEFTRKAQLAHYESTRAQFESFAALGWAGHKMTIYWMLNSHWPSFFGNIFDYYLRPGGAYYGAKKGLRPLSAVFDSYATGDHSQANVTAVNQTPDDEAGLRVRVRVYDLQGRVRDDQTSRAGDRAVGRRRARDDAAEGWRATRGCSSSAANCSARAGQRARRERLLAVATQRRRRRSRRRLRLRVEPGELGRHDRRSTT